MDKQTINLSPSVDPVCGMTVDPAATPHKAQHQGAGYFFCSGGCRNKFVADPARYLNDVKKLADPRMEGRGAGTRVERPISP